MKTPPKEQSNKCVDQFGHVFLEFSSKCQKCDYDYSTPSSPTEEWEKIVDHELNYWKDKDIFTMGDEQSIPMVKFSMKRVLSSQLETLVGEIEGMKRKFEPQVEKNKRGFIYYLGNVWHSKCAPTKITEKYSTKNRVKR